MDDYVVPARACRLCGDPLTRARTWLGYTGCFDCEQLHLFGQIAAGPPDWWIDPDVWLHAYNSKQVRIGLTFPIPYGET